MGKYKGKTEGIKLCTRCGSSTTYINPRNEEDWRYHDGKVYCKLCHNKLFRTPADRAKEKYRHKKCRLCDIEIHKGEYNSPITGKWLCNFCKKSLLDNIDNTKLERVLIEIDLDEAILEREKERAKLWVIKMFERMKEGFIEYGYNDEQYEGFLVSTYKNTQANFPETIEVELNEV